MKSIVVRASSAQDEAAVGSNRLEPARPASKSPYTREQFLQTLGLEFDPFQLPVSEQELAFTNKPQSIGDNRSLQYFVPPAQLSPAGDSLLQALRQPGLGLVYGEYGMGKTSLRLALEAKCRREPDGTLITSYLFGPSTRQRVSFAEHRRQMTKEMAIDAFVQIVEQFQPGKTILTPGRVEAMARLLGAGGPHLKRLAYRIADNRILEDGDGLEVYWHLVKRFAVRHVAADPALSEFIQRSLQVLENSGTPPTNEWPVCLNAVKTWGFDRIFVLVDGVDNRQSSPRQIRALLRPLMERVSSFAEESISLKLFVPVVLKELLDQFQNENPGWFAATDVSSVVLGWKKEALRQLLAARFRAGGSRRVGLDDLASTEFKQSLDELILDTAQGSPRQLLQLVSRLIDVYVSRRFLPNMFDELITPDDWEQVLTEPGFMPV
jgi:hypothetical protein